MTQVTQNRCSLSEYQPRPRRQDPSYALTVGQFFINRIVEVLWRIRIGAMRRTDEYGGIPEHRETTVVVGSRLHVNHLWRKYQSLPEDTKYLVLPDFIQIYKSPATSCVYVSCPQKMHRKEFNKTWPYWRLSQWTRNYSVLGYASGILTLQVRTCIARTETNIAVASRNLDIHETAIMKL